MNYAYNCNGLRSVSLREALDHIADAGYSGVELSIHPGHLLPGEDSPSEPHAIRRQLAARGLEAPCLATGSDLLLSSERFEPSLISATAEGRERRIRFLADAMDLARRLEVPMVSLASGILRSDVSPAEAAGHLREGLERLLEMATPDLILLLEPEPEFFLETNRDVVAVIDDLGNAHLRLNQDIGHSKVCEDDYLGSIERALPWTRHIHVEDIVGRHHYHEIPGDGDLDFVGLFEILGRSEYDGFLSVELYNHSDRFDEALTRSLAHLEAARRSATAVIAG